MSATARAKSTVPLVHLPIETEAQFESKHQRGYSQKKKILDWSKSEMPALVSPKPWSFRIGVPEVHLIAQGFFRFSCSEHGRCGAQESSGGFAMIPYFPLVFPGDWPSEGLRLLLARWALKSLSCSACRSSRGMFLLRALMNQLLTCLSATQPVSKWHDQFKAAIFQTHDSMQSQKTVRKCKKHLLRFVSRMSCCFCSSLGYA